MWETFLSKKGRKVKSNVTLLSKRKKKEKKKKKKKKKKEKKKRECLVVQYNRSILFTWKTWIYK